MIKMIQRKFKNDLDQFNRSKNIGGATVKIDDNGIIQIGFNAVSYPVIIDQDKKYRLTVYEMALFRKRILKYFANKGGKIFIKPDGLVFNIIY